MRVGIVGSGFWAEQTHCESLSSHPGIEFTGIWARNEAEAKRLGTKYGLEVFSSYEDLLDDSDIIDFAVPPATQGELALVAARRGKHLLLEKPLCQSPERARAIEREVSAQGVAATVFLTRLFDPLRRSWLDTQRAKGHTRGHVQWISAALHPSSPYSHSPWRQDDGMVWDVGPHVLSQLIFVLGPISSFEIDSVGDDGLVSTAFHHESGATSSSRMTARALPEQKEEWMTLTGPAGEALCPTEPIDFVTAHKNSVSALMAQILGAPVDPHELSSLPRSVEMVQALSLLDTAIKNRVVGHIISLEGP